MIEEYDEHFAEEEPPKRWTMTPLAWFFVFLLVVESVAVKYFYY